MLLQRLIRHFGGMLRLCSSWLRLWAVAWVQQRPAVCVWSREGWFNQRSWCLSSQSWAPHTLSSPPKPEVPVSAFLSFLEPALNYPPPPILSGIPLASVSALFFSHPWLQSVHVFSSLTSFPSSVPSLPAGGRGALGAAAAAQGQLLPGGDEAGQHPARVPRGDLHL